VPLITRARALPPACAPGTRAVAGGEWLPQLPQDSGDHAQLSALLAATFAAAPAWRALAALMG
jgi:hypothetical protein